MLSLMVEAIGFATENAVEEDWTWQSVNTI